DVGVDNHDVGKNADHRAESPTFDGEPFVKPSDLVREDGDEAWSELVTTEDGLPLLKPYEGIEARPVALPGFRGWPDAEGRSRPNPTLEAEHPVNESAEHPRESLKTQHP
ncbi:MAG: hypothetical protein ABEJ30_08025, partial [Halorientalis sp.]